MQTITEADVVPGSEWVHTTSKNTVTVTKLEKHRSLVTDRFYTRVYVNSDYWYLMRRFTEEGLFTPIKTVLTKEKIGRILVNQLCLKRK